MLKLTSAATLVLGLLIVSTACRGQAQDSGNQTWQTASPADVGLDPAALDRLRSDAAAGRFNNLHSILVAKIAGLRETIAARLIHKRPLTTEPGIPGHKGKTNEWSAQNPAGNRKTP